MMQILPNDVGRVRGWAEPESFAMQPLVVRLEEAMQPAEIWVLLQAAVKSFLFFKSHESRHRLGYITLLLAHVPVLQLGVEPVQLRLQFMNGA